MLEHGNRKNRRPGFTLVELLVVIAILAVLVAVVVPGSESLFQKSQTSAAIQKTMSVLRYARSEAIHSNKVTTLCPSRNGRACQRVPWHEGILLFSDRNANGKIDPEDTIKRFETPFISHGSLTWRALHQRVQFNGRGMARGTVGSFVYCPTNKNPEYAASIIVSFQGRTRFGHDTNKDGIKETGSFKNIWCS